MGETKLGKKIRSFAAGAAVVLVVGSWLYMNYYPGIKASAGHFAGAMLNNPNFLGPNAGFTITCLDYLVWILVVGVPIALLSLAYSD